MDQAQFDRLLQHIERIAGALEQLAASGSRPADAAPSTVIAFDVTELVPEMLDGETYWKVKGGRFTKHGVRIWPEVLEAAGLVDLELKKKPLPGWRAEAQLGDNDQPKKVIRLIPPATAPAPGRGDAVAFVDRKQYLDTAARVHNLRPEAAERIAQIAGVRLPNTDHTAALAYLPFFGQAKQLGLDFAAARTLLEQQIMDPDAALAALTKQHAQPALARGR